MCLSFPLTIVSPVWCLTENNFAYRKGCFMKNRKAFTLIELIVVIVIIVILGCVVFGGAGIAFGFGRVVGGINATASKGTRIGKIIKFGEKTNIFGGYRSWEGAMQVSDFALQSQNKMNSTVNGNVWDFSLYKDASPELTDKILLALKTMQPISLTYTQWGSRPATIETEYVITAAEFPEELKK